MDDDDDDDVILLFTYFDFPRTRSRIPISPIQYSARPTRIHGSRRFRGTHPHVGRRFISLLVYVIF
jgi:hypothetical protein